MQPANAMPGSGEGAPGDPAQWREGRALLVASGHAVLAAACALAFFQGTASGWLTLALLGVQAGLVVLMLMGARWSGPAAVLGATPALAWMLHPWLVHGDGRSLPWAMTLLAGGLALALVARGSVPRLVAAAIGGALSLLALTAYASLSHLAEPVPLRLALLVVGMQLVLWPGAHREPAAIAHRLAMAVLGACALMLLAWVVPSPAILRGYADASPMQPIGALLLLGSAVGLHLALRERMVPTLMVSGAIILVQLVAVAAWMLGAALEMPQVPESGRLTGPGVLAANTWLALLACQVGVLALARRRRNQVLPSVAWACGLLVGAAGVLGLAGHVLGLPDLQGWGAQIRMALPTALILLPLAAALGLGGLALQRDGRLADALLPVAVGAFSLLVGLQLWYVVSQKEREFSELTADYEIESLRSGVQAGTLGRMNALVRFARRIDAIDDEDDQARLFDADATQYLQDFANLRAIGQLDERRRVVRVLGVSDRYQALIGRADDADPSRRRAYDAVDASGQPRMTDPIPLPEGGFGQLIMIPRRDGGYVTASFNFETMMEELITPALATGGVQVGWQGVELYRRGTTAGPPLRTASVELFDQRWDVSLWPGPDQRARQLSMWLLASAFVVSGLLAFLLRASALARRRLHRAEAVGRDLGEQILVRERAEAALQEREQENRSLLESLSDGFLVLDRHRQVHYLNPEAARRFRQPRETLQGIALDKLFRPEEAQEIMGCCERVFARGSSHAAEIYSTTLQGWFELRAHPHPRGAAVYLRDIEERKRIDLSLRRTSAELEAALASKQMMMDSSLDVICTLDAGGRFVQISAACKRMWGYSPEDLSGARFLELVHPEDLDASRERFASIVAGSPTSDFRNRFLKREGGSMVNQWSAVWSERHQMMFCIARDITASLAAEQALRAAQQRVVDARESLLRAQEIANIGSWELDTASGSLQLSPQGCRILGIDPARFSGRIDEAILSYVHHEDRARVRAALEALSEKGVPMDMQHRVVRADGEVRYVHQLARLVDVEAGEARRITGTMQDRTERHLLEDALREAQSLFAIAGRAARIGGWSLELDGMRLVWSDEVCRIHARPPGYLPTLEEGIQYYLPADRARVRALVSACIEEGIDFDEEFQLDAADGRRLWVRVVAQAVRDADGRIVRMEGAFQDITERRSADAERLAQARALADAHERLNAHVENTPLAVVELDEDLHIIRWSPRAEEMFGWSAQEALGQRPDTLGLLPPEDEPQVTPLLADLGGGRAPRNTSLNRNRTRDGRLLHCEWYNSTTVGPDGRRTILSLAQDITERRLAEEALAQATRERESALEGLRRVMEHSLDVICVFDREGRFIEVSQAAEAIWGYAPSELAGTTLDTLVHPDDLARTYEAVAGVVDGAPRNDFRNRNVARDGTIRIMRWSAVWSESEHLLYAVGHDDTSSHEEQEFRRAQQQILQGIASRAPLERTLQELAELQDASQPEAITSILLLDEGGRVRHGAGPRLPRGFIEAIDGAPIGPKAGSCGTAAWRRERVVVEDIGSDPLWDDYRALAEAHGLRACWSTPVLDVDGSVLGTFAVYYGRPRAPSGRELEQIDGLSSLAAIAIAQHRAYARIRASEQRFRSLFDNHPDAICALDASGRYVLANQRYVSLIGMAPEELAGRHYRDVVAPQNLASIDAAVQASLDGEIARYEINRSLADGRVLYFSCLNVPVTVDGRVVGLFAILAEVTALREAEDSLRQRDLFFGMSMEMFSIGDPASRHFIQVNPAFSRVLGFSAAELVMRPWDDFILEEDRGQTLAAVQGKASPGTRIENYVNRFRTADGGARWLEWTGQIGPDGLFYAAARDITARIEAEQALKQVMDDLRSRNRELQDFAFVASHDLQEPLRKIRTFSDRLTRRLGVGLDPQSGDYLSRMNQAAARMQRLIDDLLAYSRVGSRAARMAPVELDKVVGGVLSDLESRIEAVGAKIEVPALPTLVADETQMRQLFQNLLANALKFVHPERTPELAIRVGRVREAAGYGWRFQLRDNGVGFAQHHAERIFTPFQRLHGRSEYEGTGIGLAIVRRIVERHGGWIHAEGEEGQGAIFTFFLPETPPRRQSDPSTPDVLP